MRVMVERTNFDITATIEEDIVALDVSMNDVLLMQVLQPLTSLLQVS